MNKTMGREKRVILSLEEEVAVRQLLDELSRDLHTTVKLSNAIRSCLLLLQHARRAIRRTAQQSGILSRPPNNNHAAIASFELRLAAIFQSGIKQSERVDEQPANGNRTVLQGEKA